MSVRIPAPRRWSPRLAGVAVMLVASLAGTRPVVAQAGHPSGPLRGELAEAGVSSTEAASVLGAFMYAGRRITREESAIAMGNQAPPLPAGPLKDNVTLIRQHEGELQRMTQSPGRKDGR